MDAFNAVKWPRFRALFKFHISENLPFSPSSILFGLMKLDWWGAHVISHIWRTRLPKHDGHLSTMLAAYPIFLFITFIWWVRKEWLKTRIIIIVRYVLCIYLLPNQKEHGEFELIFHRWSIKNAHLFVITARWGLRAS